MQPLVAVACSGGRDSTALLHATLRAATPLGLGVLALHVHHGLMPEADTWQTRVRQQCQRWARQGAPLRFLSERLKSQPAPGQSIEAWAREQRYQALARMALAEGCDTVLLAHHRRDQAETFLLQALRGAGVAGLAAMPAAAERQGIHWLRPWLQQPRAAIDAYVQRHRLAHVEDGSNADARYARSRLRQQVWPALEAGFPQAEQVLADAAGWAQQATEALQELAGIDLPRVTEGEALVVAAWAGLSPVRRSNALRAWLQSLTGSPAAASLVTRLLAELSPDGEAVGMPTGEVRHWPGPHGVLRLHQGRLCRLTEPGGNAPPPRSTQAPAPPAVARLAIRRAGRYPLAAWGGTLEVRRVREGGVPLAWLAHAELRPRQGGEQFQAGLLRPLRSLKKQYQAAQIPAWLRDGPLVYSGGQLVFVPGLGMDARVIGLPGQGMVVLSWHRHDAD